MPRIKVNMVEVAKASARIKIAENAVKDVSDDINYARWRVDDRIAERRGIGSRLNQITNTISQIESDMENIENTINRGASRYSDTENNIVASGREIKNRIRAQIFTAEAAAGALGISKDLLKITGIDKVLEKIWDGNQESGKTVPVSNNEKITDVKSNNESVWNQGTDLVGSVAGVGAAASTVDEVKRENGIANNFDTNKSLSPDKNERLNSIKGDSIMAEGSTYWQNGSYYKNGMWNASQCLGFAKEVQERVYGKSGDNKFTISSFDDIKPGDVLCYDSLAEKTDATYGHSVFVIGKTESGGLIVAGGNEYNFTTRQYGVVVWNREISYNSVTPRYVVRV